MKNILSVLLVVAIIAAFVSMFGTMGNRTETSVSDGSHQEQTTVAEDSHSEDSGESALDSDFIAEDIPDSVHIWDTFIFGSYEQDNDLSNGTEGIEWVVIDKNEESVLVISKYALDCLQYDSQGNEGYSHTAEDTTWADCSLRTWLNDNFFNNVFSPEQQGSIITTKVTAVDNGYYGTEGGEDTEDKIFLLSLPEANIYFLDNSYRTCQATEYAIAQGAKTDLALGGSCWWWLRSPGDMQNHAAYVYSDGDAYNGLAYLNVTEDAYISVRPAMWIARDALQ